MFEHDRSAARGKMATRKLFVFKRESDLNDASVHNLFELIAVQRKPETNPPRNSSDYEVTVDKAGVPQGMTLIETGINCHCERSDALSGVMVAGAVLMHECA